MCKKKQREEDLLNIVAAQTLRLSMGKEKTDACETNAATSLTAATKHQEVTDASSDCASNQIKGTETIKQSKNDVASESTTATKAVSSSTSDKETTNDSSSGTAAAAAAVVEASVKVEAIEAEVAEKKTCKIRIVPLEKLLPQQSQTKEQPKELPKVLPQRKSRNNTSIIELSDSDETEDEAAVVVNPLRRKAKATTSGSATITVLSSSSEDSRPFQRSKIKIEAKKRPRNIVNLFQSSAEDSDSKALWVRQKVINGKGKPAKKNLRIASSPEESDSQAADTGTRTRTKTSLKRRRSRSPNAAGGQVLKAAVNGTKEQKAPKKTASITSPADRVLLQIASDSSQDSNATRKHKSPDVSRSADSDDSVATKQKKTNQKNASKKKSSKKTGSGFSSVDRWLLQLESDFSEDNNAPEKEKTTKKIAREAANEAGCHFRGSGPAATTASTEELLGASEAD
ncbi:transcriptional regulator ATRX homolog [Drosophila obscura]|uniref:transcriptional regulator ATRX homolog n=1 Tax=Drosophila obscura TaxID=7282 RepID=UPI001BB298F1|nr:transcriptional regulator ATRX homolog [Drosophila obscura]